MQSNTPAEGFHTSCEWLQDIVLLSKELIRVMQDALKVYNNWYFLQC